jgi:serine/threonine-protein kinase
VGGVLLSAAAAYIVGKRDRDIARMNFLSRAERLHAAVTEGLKRPFDGVAALKGLFLASSDVSRSDFRVFARSLLERDPSVYAFEWLPRVPDSGVRALEETAWAEGLTEFRVYEPGPDGRPRPPSPRPTRVVVMYMEPPDRDALGLDITYDPIRQGIARKALDRGKPVASGRFRLVEDRTGQAPSTMAIYQAVYGTDGEPASQQQREESLRGYVVALYQISPTLTAAVRLVDTRGLSWSVWDLSEEREEDLLFESAPGAAQLVTDAGPLTRVFRAGFADRTWKIGVAAPPEFLAGSGRALAVGLGGSLLTLATLATITALRTITRLRRQVERVGPYTLTGKLGAGAMGVVFQARHALLRRPTAIKLLAPSVAGERALARFEREVQMTSALTHPSTIAIYDYGRTSEGVFYYAMELLKGLNLQQLVLYDGAVPPGRVVHFLTQACGALAEAHGAGLIHRDIKPANLMACVYGGIPDFLKILDFGLVKDIAGVDLPRPEGTPAAEPSVALSQDGALLGTPLFLAPEGISNPGKVDARLDIYGLGAVAYYLLAGSPPYEGTTAIEIYGKQRRGAPPPPSEKLGRPLPSGLENLVLKCLEALPEDRPASARDLRTSLESCNGFEPWTEEMAVQWWATRGPEIERLVRKARVEAGEAGTLTSAESVLAPAERS